MNILLLLWLCRNSSKPSTESLELDSTVIARRLSELSKGL